MTPEEWDVCGDPKVMIDALRSNSHRKARLLAVACCCRLASFLPPIASKERDNLLNALHDRADQSLPNNWSDAIWADYEFVREFDGVEGFGEIVDSYMMITCTGLAGGLMNAKYAAEGNGTQGEEEKQAALVRCVFGNPFRPVIFDPAWRTSDVLALAKGIYEERAFDRMPILADALQDAGCDNDDILSHCRDTSTPHARGCWVVDLVLGKA